MEDYDISTIPRVQLQQAVRMPLVQLWLALLLGEYAIEQWGKVYDVQPIWVIRRVSYISGWVIQFVCVKQFS